MTGTGDMLFVFYLMRATCTQADECGVMRDSEALCAVQRYARISHLRIYRALRALYAHGLICAAGDPARITPRTPVALLGDVTAADVYAQEAH